jgi:hypothetical protein
MFDDLCPSTLAYLAFAGAAVGAGLGFLAAGRLRSGLITAWALVPVWLMTVAAIAGGFSFGTLTFGLFFLLFTLPIFGVVKLLPFHLVRRVREIHAGEPD